MCCRSSSTCHNHSPTGIFRFEGHCAYNSAAQSHQCPGDDSWDFSQPPGFYALWSAAGREDYEVTGPHDVTNDGRFDAGVHTRSLDAPPSLRLQPARHLHSHRKSGYATK